MSMRCIVALVFLLTCLFCSASKVDYDSARKWVEKQCATNTIPENERMFVFRWVSPRYAAIVRFHEGITLREIIDQTPRKGKMVYAVVMRTEPLKAGHYTTRRGVKVGPKDKPRFELKRQDVIWLLDDEVIVET